MSADFDIAAHTYDEDFTNSAIGKLQRKRVWRLLDEAFKDSVSLKILELNCGTGEDAVRLAKGGNSVIATDVSEKMLEVARSKYESHSIKFMRLDLNEFDQNQFDGEFDLVFSNFGGLNCIDAKSINKLGASLANVLKRNGKFIAVIMPKVCLWETAYLILKGKIAESFRRNRDFAEVDVSGKIVKTWYYNPKNFSDLIGKGFKRGIIMPIGLFVPPSYMESFFRKRKNLLGVFNAFEKAFANFSWQARFSDHYYIELSKE